jgi:hypothetical protein
MFCARMFEMQTVLCADSHASRRKTVRNCNFIKTNNFGVNIQVKQANSVISMSLNSRQPFSYAAAEVIDWAVHSRRTHARRVGLDLFTPPACLMHSRTNLPHRTPMRQHGSVTDMFAYVADKWTNMDVAAILDITKTSLKMLNGRVKDTSVTK